MIVKTDNSGGTVYQFTANEYDALDAKGRALDVAVRGLREMEDAWARRRDQVEYGESPRAACVVALAEISALLDKIGAVR